MGEEDSGILSTTSPHPDMRRKIGGGEGGKTGKQTSMRKKEEGKETGVLPRAKNKKNITGGLKRIEGRGRGGIKKRGA